MVYTTTLYPSSYSIVDHIICTSIPPIRVQETLLAVPCINKWMNWVHLKVHQIILGLKWCAVEKDGLTNYKNDQCVRSCIVCFTRANRFSFEICIWTHLKFKIVFSLNLTAQPLFNKLIKRTYITPERALWSTIFRSVIITSTRKQNIVVFIRALYMRMVRTVIVD